MKHESYFLNERAVFGEALFSLVRMDPRNTEINLDSLMFSKLPELSDADKQKQEADYIYRYRYNGGGASQVWLRSGRYVVIDLSAGPCTYGKIETEEGSVSPRTVPRIRNIFLPGNVSPVGHQSTTDIFSGQLAALVATTIEHVIAPDVRFETVDLATRVLVPIIVLQNHNRYNIMERGQNYSINIEEIKSEVKKMIHHGQEVVIVGGVHPLHRHEKLAIVVSKAMRGHSLQETKNNGRFHEMERSTDVLAAGLLDVSDPGLSNKYFLRQKDIKNKTKTELWVEKFYKKTTTLPEPFPHELVERVEKYLDTVEEQLVDLSSLLYDHKLYDAHLNSSEILQTTMFTQQYVEHVLETERENMRCSKIEYKYTVGVKSYQTLVYGGILVAGFLVYFLVIFFSSPPSR
ncbi:PREDICTED: uncharacterized protein LOC104733595 [Camelina sativa]|uniref:Uncharacterized protein LOC104733595 n=1 Tax=Camelina sativa TaxID=90675 RepID=A0ABM0V675_CAMSA|nr:PREDICTED: uncharacterized protein LOC104733595 [Camelina sativa]